MFCNFIKIFSPYVSICYKKKPETIKKLGQNLEGFSPFSRVTCNTRKNSQLQNVDNVLKIWRLCKWLKMKDKAKPRRGLLGV